MFRIVAQGQLIAAHRLRAVVLEVVGDAHGRIGFRHAEVVVPLYGILVHTLAFGLLLPVFKFFTRSFSRSHSSLGFIVMLDT